ncbi:class I SAM-dependent methyltransferase [Pseudomarimonas arenosa]|uniref:SAM-dependent methyltransferase n=1 Tax=Pseudomarimonas arenosa TaxID=2774145 RepID=A0AAW3ZHB4_9GAMM|nr:SAM-dependent methyltransferase [Pseudomarimonas arenosa]MBD8524649.1 SAM-dependent methyltransferase [Pseudomarimonas arenosa]
MPHYTGPLITRRLLEVMCLVRDRGEPRFEGSFDLGRSRHEAEVTVDDWRFGGQSFPWPEKLKDRTIYYWDGDTFAALQRFAGSLIKLVPTEWGAPTFEIDGIKMLPTSQVSPFADAERKVSLIKPNGKRILDTCGGLGYFAACSLVGGAADILSFEKNVDVLWLRQHNPWSPDPDSIEAGGRLRLQHGDVSQQILVQPDQCFDAALHDPPRFGIAGELYSQSFYDQLYRVLRPGAPLFHYTGTPNAKTSGRDVPAEVSKRLVKCGFKVRRELDGVFAEKPSKPSRR